MLLPACTLHLRLSAVTQHANAQKIMYFNVKHAECQETHSCQCCYQLVPCDVGPCLPMMALLLLLLALMIFAAAPMMSLCPG